MTSGSVQTKGIAETFDDLAHDRCCKYKSNGLTASSQVLLDFISNKGLVERLFSRSGVEQASSPWRPSGMEHLPAWAWIFRRQRFTKPTSSPKSLAYRIAQGSMLQTRPRLANLPLTSS